MLIVLPLMLVEFAIGRRGQADATRAIVNVATEAGASRLWGLCGLLGVATACLILSFYSVISGWAIHYAVDTTVHGLAGDDGRALQARYDALLAAPLTMTGYHSAYMVAIGFIVARGISRGIDDACKILMPILIGLMVGLSAFSLLHGDAAAALRFLFWPDLSHFTFRIALEALGLGFFSISVGLSVMITYAAYARPDIDLRKVAIFTIVGDSAVSIAAGLAIFPIVFAEGLDPAQGPGLMFVTLPLAFAQIPGGDYAAMAFFVLLIVAAVASGISLLEMPVALLVRRGWSRPRATFVAASACWAVGLATVLSFNHWRNWHPLSAVELFAKATIFDLLDHLTSNLMLPLGGLVLSIFAGWFLPMRLFTEQIGLGPRPARLFELAVRYIVPVGIAALALLPILGAR